MTLRRKNRSSRKRPAADLLLEVLVGGGDHAHVHGHASPSRPPARPAAPGARAAPWPGSSGSCRRPRRGTGCRRRPARTCPCLAASAPVKAPARVAEQLALDQLLGDGRAVHLDERAPRRAGSGGGCCARPAPCRCRSRRRSARGRWRARPARSRRAARGWPALSPTITQRCSTCCLERAVLRLEPPLAQRVLHHQQRLLERQRLLDEVLRAHAHGLDRGLDACRGRRSPPPAARRRGCGCAPASRGRPCRAARRRAAAGRSGAPPAPAAPASPLSTASTT